MNINELIKKNIPLVKSVVNSFSPKNEEYRDQLFSAGLSGLWEAIEDYDISKYKTKLTTIAIPKIRWRIINKIHELRTKNVPLSYNEAYYDKNPMWENEPDDLSQLEKEIIFLKLHNYSVREIAKKLNTSHRIIYRTYNSLIQKLQRANCAS